MGKVSTRAGVAVAVVFNNGTSPPTLEAMLRREEMRAAIRAAASILEASVQKRDAALRKIRELEIRCQEPAQPSDTLFERGHCSTRMAGEVNTTLKGPSTGRCINFFQEL
jgi:hypothetical protein